MALVSAGCLPAADGSCVAVDGPEIFISYPLRTRLDVPCCVQGLLMWCAGTGVAAGANENVWPGSGFLQRT